MLSIAAKSCCSKTYVHRSTFEIDIATPTALKFLSASSWLAHQHVVHAHLLLSSRSSSVPALHEAGTLHSVLLVVESRSARKRPTSSRTTVASSLLLIVRWLLWIAVGWSLVGRRRVAVVSTVGRRVLVLRIGRDHRTAMRSAIACL